MGFLRQECWSGLPFPSPGGLPDPGIEPRSPALQADSLLTELVLRTFVSAALVSQQKNLLWVIILPKRKWQASEVKRFPKAPAVQARLEPRVSDSYFSLA